MKKALPATVFILFLLYARFTSGQIVINEFVPANISGLTNSNGDYDDWIEIYNAGSNSVNLSGYGLSDDVSEPYKFRFPSYDLDDGHHVIIFINDFNNNLPVHHWETAVKSNTSWKYFAGTTQPDTNWRNLSFDESTWSSGTGGIGYGDGDDQKTITTNARSVMMRKTFNITDTSDILKAIFNIDYDDGFVAFLNGSEIARANLGVPGDRPNYNDFAIVSHEAVMYQGDDPDSFYIDPGYLKSILRIGTNVLAVEVHNQTSSSNDLSSIPFLSFGMKTSGSTFSNPPSWFGTHPAENFSAKFKLARSGETIYLTNASGNVIDQQTYVSMESDNSLGRKPDGGANWCLIKTPTPGASNNNSTCYTGYANPPVFSVAAGFYSSNQTVTLTNNTPGGTIRYTTNGDVPTSSSPSYSSSLHINASKTIRARVFASGYLPSPVVTNTYIINTTIKLPVFCITTDSLNLWDYNTGIYVMGPNAQPTSPYKDANFWQDWKKPASIEYYDKNKNRVFNFDAEIRIYGNYSRSKPQKSMEILLSDRYGTGDLNYTFIPDKPYIDKVNDLVLRNGGTDWNVVHFRDAFMERVMRTTNSGYIGTEPVVMYLNGSYWGVFTIHENHDQHWIKNNFGYDDDVIDYMIESGSDIDAKRGDDHFFWDSYNYATSESPTSATYYSNMNNYWDLDNYKDYFICETYYNNGDWIGDWTNNIKHWRPRDGKLRYLLYDLDFGCGGTGNYNDNRLNIAINPASFSNSSNMFRSMLNNPQFKREFINRYADLVNTVFKPSYALGIMHQFEDSMAYDMTKHFAKWGSTTNSWQSHISSMESFINHRPDVARDQIQSQFGLIRQVTLTFNVNPAGAGRIQVSTIVPTSYPWTGVYFNGNPVTITAIPNPGYTFDRWDSNHAINNDHNQTTTYDFASATESITAYFSGSTQAPSVTISEFNYNSDGALNSGDWIELHNYSSSSLNISGWKLKDSDDLDSYVFPVGTNIPAHSYLVVASNLTNFESIFPTVNNVMGPLGFNLSNSGDQIRLFDANDIELISFYYDDVAPWPVEADGQGYTCQLSSNTANPNDGNNWAIGCIGGSPGQQSSSGLTTSTHLNGNTTFCQGGYTLLHANYTPGYSYQWLRNSIDIPGATDTTFTASLDGMYSVRVMNQGCSGISDTLDVVVVLSGQTPFANSVSRCGEGVVTLTASAPDSIYWFDSAINGNIIGTGSSFTTPTLSNTTTYYAQTSLGCPSTRVLVEARINGITATPVVSNVSRCGVGSVSIHAVDTAIVKWYNASNGGGLLFTGNTFVTGLIPHDTIFYCEAGSVCISDRVSVNVAINSASPPLTNDVSRCGPGSMTITASSLAPIFWYDSMVAGNQVGAGISFNTPVLSATKTYYVESNNGCSSERVPVIAMINEIPNAPVGFDSTFCEGGVVSLYATADVQIFWYDSPAGGASLGSGSLFNTPDLTTTTTYYAEAIDICSSPVRTPIRAIIEPRAATPVGNDAIICGSGAAFLTAQAIEPVYWFASENGGPVLAVGNNFTTPVLDSTTVFYAVAISACSSTPYPVVATVFPNPNISLGTDTVIESGSSVVLDAGAGYDFYNWSTGATTRSISVSSTNTYSVEVGLNGCTGIATINVTVVTGLEELIIPNGTIRLYPNPVKENLTLRFESKKPINSEFLIYDITGKELYREEFKLSNGINSQNIDMSSFAKGMYLVTIRSVDFMKTMRVVVE